MKKFVIAFAIAATAVMAFGAPQGGGVRRAAAAKGVQRFADTLGLSDAQREQIQTIRKSNFEKNKQLFSDFRAKREEYRQLRQSNDPRAADLRLQLQSMGEQVRTARQTERDAILDVLTPEQRTQLEQLRAQKRSRG
jgi:Spy/CpxP family protein refolding chaperone